jgi:hypothetical protein
MENEQWLEEAMLITNKSLHLVPDGYLRESIKSCRDHGFSLESAASAVNQVGLINKEGITEIKERIPEPSSSKPRPDDIQSTRKTHKAEIESCRFLMNCMMGATKELPVIFDFQPTDEKDDENIRRILSDMADRIKQDEKKSHNGGEDGNGNNYSS